MASACAPRTWPSRSSATPPPSSPRDDLTRIDSLGFRGEALPSIGAVARLTITTRTAEADFGAPALTVDAGRKGRGPACIAARGTRIEVGELFSATPARLKFLKSDRAENAAIADILRRLAVAHPGIRFTLRTESGSPLDFPPRRRTARPPPCAGSSRCWGRISARTRCRSIWRARASACPAMSACRPSTGARRNHIHFTVNGRPVRDRLLLGAVRGRLADTMASDRHPVLALSLACDPGGRRQRPPGEDRAALP